MRTLHTRRSFLRQSALGGSLALSAPAFVGATFRELAAGQDRPVAADTGRDAPILVVLQLAGGNDGLNTVVPVNNDDYRRARPRLAIAATDALRLDDTTGLHPAMTGAKELFDSGLLSIVQGVGYPNPNRSHFRSTDIWMTGSSADEVRNRGWLGQYFDNACHGSQPPAGLSVGRSTPLAFASERVSGVAMQNPNSLRFFPGEEDSMKTTSARYRSVSGGGDIAALGTSEEVGASIADVAGSGPASMNPVDFLERTALDAQITADRVQAVAARGKANAHYPTSPLGNDLRFVARLISGGLATRVYYLSQGGYDTHAQQAPAHRGLLADLGESLAAFLNDMKAAGALDRVLVMTFSEFGRRVAENGSGGTDHGAASSLFLAGGRVKAGLHGRVPSLAPADLVNGDPKHEIDFRSVYAGILEHWLKTPSAPILGRSFHPLEVV
jgi:uncharacterized protein (DUF1501 family)